MNHPSHAYEFQTTDLGQAAYLVTLGHPLQRIDGAPGERRFFIFDADAAGDATEYFRGGRVPAQLYSLAIRNLKVQLFPLRR